MVRKPRLKWPKPNELSLYNQLEDTVLSTAKKGKKDEYSIEQDLQRLAETIYNIGEGLFGTMLVGGKERNLRGPSRRGRKTEAIKKEKKALR